MMSYSRWSTVINSRLKFKDELFLYKNGVPYENVQKIKLRGRKPELSNWYIYWDCMSGSELEDQFLAIWQCTEDKIPIEDYTVVKEMYLSNNWEPLGYTEITQIDHLRSCIKRWLEDVEEEFS